VTSFEQDDEGVTVQLADGTTARADMLVGADGIRSAVRTQLLPEVPVIPTGIEGIGVFGRTPITPELDELVPDLLNQGVLIAADRTGTRLLIASFRPRRAATEAAAERAPDVEIDDVPAYFMISCSVEHGFEVPSARDWTESTAKEIRDSQLRAIDGWHPGARALVERQDLDSMFMIPFGFLQPAEDWESSRVTIIGDAAHGMLPTLGMGANLSLNDSAVLLDQLERVAQGEIEIPEALGAYEAQMREIAYPILRRTLQHDENFGGGGLQQDAGTGAVGL
jgi:2-polyprenyl-6-methoxyphenol hydroxylase-like FAD-dependent oxidoreductase